MTVRTTNTNTDILTKPLAPEELKLVIEVITNFEI